MKYIKIEGKKYLLRLVENILGAVDCPLPGRTLVSLGRPQSALFESLISLKVLDLKPVAGSYDEFVKGERFDSWMLANTTLKPFPAPAPTLEKNTQI